MGNHHLILGELIDYITGETLTDTHDERLRQELAKWLVENKLFQKKELLPRKKILAVADVHKAWVPLDFQVEMEQKIGMIVKYAPGSITTRHRPALALSRLAVPYQVPIVVVTNGRTADVLDGDTGRRLAEGLDGIPDRPSLLAVMAQFNWQPIEQKQYEMESRILYAFEVEGACPCDDTVCKIS
jgi:Type I restriction enzyme R protein N terminus (HSDR_N)